MCGSMKGPSGHCPFVDPQKNVLLLAFQESYLRGELQSTLMGYTSADSYDIIRLNP